MSSFVCTEFVSFCDIIHSHFYHVTDGKIDTELLGKYGIKHRSCIFLWNCASQL